MLARTLMGILPREAMVGKKASIHFQGQDLRRLKAKRLQRIIGREMAIIFQDSMTALNPVMTVGQQIGEVISHHLNLDRQPLEDRVWALLRQVGIPMPEERIRQYPHQLSGGLRQRVAISIALACKPKLLIADEPTTALDVTVQADILDLLAGLQAEEQMAMILISHDLGVVAGRTHTTAVMYAGKIVEQAPSDRLFIVMAMPYTRALMDAIPQLEDAPHTELQAIDGQPPDLAEIQRGCRFAPRCRFATQKCRDDAPELRLIDGNNHWVACWHPLER